MKKIAGIFLGVICLCLVHCLPAAAQDIWVDHWKSSNTDIYVMSETLSYDVDSTGRRFYISTKRVQDGKLKGIIRWTFDKYKSDMWRYETNEMDGTHMTVVTPVNRIFEYGMKQLGWSYEIQEYWYY